MDKSGRIFLGIAALVCSLILFPALADAMTAGEVKDDGTACTLPDLSFEWLGSSQLNLVLKAEVPRPFLVRLRTHRSSQNNHQNTGDSTKVPPCGQAVEKMWIPSETIDADGKKIVSTEDKQWYSLSSPKKNGGDYISRVDLNPDDLCLMETDGFVVVEWTLPEDETRATCDDLKQGESDPIVALRRHTLAFDAGPVFSLENDGSFETGTEVAVSSVSRWTGSITAYSDLRFSQIGAIDEKESTDEMMADAADEGMEMEPAMEEMAADDFINPFEEGGNVVSFNAWAGFHPWTRNHTRLTHPVSLILGGGFTTQPGESSQLDAKTRLFGGIRFQIARYSAEASSDLTGSSGYLQVGAARDELWKFTELQDLDGDMTTTADVMEVAFDERDRWFVETQITIPNISLGGDNSGRLKLRLYADLPRSGDGPSDVRISALFEYDLSQLISRIK